jgi:hypothetical protein
MRHPNEIQEKIDHLLWYKQVVISHFRLIDMSAKKHALLAAYYRTIDNEISMLRWVLGQTEQTWSDDLSTTIDIVDLVEKLPPTEFPHLPYGRRASEYWPTRPSRICPYFLGPDSPSDDPDFDIFKQLDPSNWKRRK